MSYAKGTEVPIERSRHEVEELLVRAGASRFNRTWDQKRETIHFEHRGMLVKFELPAPNPKDFKTTGGKRPRERTDLQVAQAITAEHRRLWRALLLVIKSKIAAVEDGISSFELEFLPWVVMKGGKTIGEHVIPKIEAAVSQGKQLQLPEFSSA